jgi:hypothetical protein
MKGGVNGGIVVIWLRSMQMLCILAGVRLLHLRLTGFGAESTPTALHVGNASQEGPATSFTLALNFGPSNCLHACCAFNFVRHRGILSVARLGARQIGEWLIHQFPFKTA